MPTYDVTDPSSGLKIRLTGDAPPSEQELDNIFAEARSRQQQPAQPSVGELRRREGAGEIAAAPPQAPLSLTPATDNVVSQPFDEKIAIAAATARTGGAGFMAPPLSTPETEAETVKQYASALSRYGVPIALAPVTGGMSLPATLATEAGIQVAGELGAQAVEGQFKPGQLAAAAIPVPPTAQKATRLAQVGEEALKGMVVGGGYSAFENLPDLMSGKISKYDYLKDVGIGAGVGGLLTPSVSGIARGVGAWSRAGTKTPFNREFLAELNRPYVQQALSERAAEIERLMRDSIQGGGLDPSLARQITDAYYSPDRVGGGIENINRFDNEIKGILSDSLINAKRNGITGERLTQEIKGVLDQIVGPPVKNADQAFSRLSGQLDSIVNQATDAADAKLSRNKERVIRVARAAEGRSQLEAKALEDRIAKLESDLASIPTLKQSEIAQLTAEEQARVAQQNVQKSQIQSEIDRLNSEKRVFEDRFQPFSKYGPELGAEELGIKGSLLGRGQLEQFKREMEAGYKPLTGQLSEIQLEIPRVNKMGEAVLDENGNQIVDSISIEALRQKRSKMLKGISWDKPVQKGDFSLFKQLEDINTQIENGLEAHPELKQALYDQNAAYREGIARFKSNIADKLLREIGEAGGKPETIKQVFSSGTELKNLKDFLGSDFDKILPDLRQYAFTQIWKSDPNQIVDTLKAAKIGKEGTLAQNVVNELFPDLKPFQDVASAYNDVITKISQKDLELKALNSQKSDLNEKIKSITGQIGELKGSTAFELSSANEQLRNVNSKINEINGKRDSLLSGISKASADEKKKIEAIADLSASVKFSQSSGKYNISDDIQRKIRETGDQGTIDALNSALNASNELKDKMNVLVSSAIKPNGKLGTFEPSEFVSWMANSSGDVKSVYKINEFMKVLDKVAPEIKGDIQDLVVGQMLDDAVRGGKIDTAKLRAMTDPEGKFGSLLPGMFGADASKKVNNIANQLDLIQEATQKKSLFSEKIVPLLAVGTGLALGGAASKAMGVGPLYTTVIGGFAGYGFRGQVSDATKAAIGKIIKNPEYLRIVSKPIDDVTQAEMKLFNNKFNDALVSASLRFQSEPKNP